MNAHVGPGADGSAQSFDELLTTDCGGEDRFSGYASVLELPTNSRGHFCQSNECHQHPHLQLTVVGTLVPLFLAKLMGSRLLHSSTRQDFQLN
mmetsp:Transcript_29898/g.67085  ORF Transcript_29898/g.67085 Transcript_29898/m.67085 type:complete len:93 (-) Transcript_29898:234-512(-)